MTARRLLAVLLAATLAAGAATAAQITPPAATRQLTPVAIPPTSAPPNAPPQNPFLRIDADFHTQTVNRFAVDRRFRVIVTGSDDKTIRIWQASDGAPLATLRVPIGPGDEGAIYAVALSPDGKTLLAGGSTGWTWDKSFCLYLFDLESGRLTGRLPDLPGPVNDIAYAPDGHAFALALGNGAGVAMVDAGSGAIVARDPNPAGRMTSVAFDRRGRLFATGYGGEVRLYDPAGRRIASRTPLPGAQPYSIALSPDERTLAVGFADRPRVELLNAADLTPRGSLANDPAGRPEGGAGGLGAVAWGADGAILAAGSLRGRDGRTVLRRWSGPGARPVDQPALRDTVFQVGPTPDGGAVLVGADPALLRLDRAGRAAFRLEGPGLDFRDVADRLFQVAEDGESVIFQTKAMAAPGVADLGKRRVGAVAASRGLTPVAAPKQAAPPAEVTDWRNSATPRIAGQPVRLAPQELSRSVAASPDGRRVVLGTDYQLRVFDAAGNPLDAADIPEAAWAVGISGDGRSLVAALGDGTLRWYGLDGDGYLSPRVSLFMAADGRRWVAWTADGFFDYADIGGGEGMVGVLLNRARNQVPQWFSFAQVFRRYYAPDTVAASLRGLGTAGPSQSAGIGDVRQTLAQSAPPSVELRALCWNDAAGRQCQKLAATGTSRSLTAVAATSVADLTVPSGASGITVQYGLRGAGPSSAVDLFINGRNGGRVVREVTATGDGTVEQTGVLDPGLNRIQLRAYDGEGKTYAESRLLEVDRTREVARAVKPTLFVLAVGINKYAPTINSLAFAVPDARSVSEKIRAAVPDTYGRAEIIELFDRDATTTGVLKALATIGDEATHNDTVLIYLSGHGATVNDRYYFITQNVPDPTDAQVETTALSEGALVNGLAAIKSNNTMVFLDTCHAGAFSLDAASKLAHETGRYILAAAESVEEALDSYDDRNGVFATAVLRGLSGQAAAGKATVNNFELGLFVTPLVRELADERHHKQSARFKIDADDARPFPIVEVAK